MLTHRRHDPDIEHIPFFAISPLFLRSLYSSYYHRIMTFDAPARFLLAFQHNLFYIVLALARFNLYANSYAFLVRSALAPGTNKAARWTMRIEVACLIGFWCWYGALLFGTGSWQMGLMYVLVSHIVASPVHVQVRACPAEGTIH